MPQTQDRNSGFPPAVRPEIATLLLSTREQVAVVGPLVEHLVSLGGQLAQRRFGRQEWRVPKRPSEAARRQGGQSFEGFPVDIAIFDDPTRVGDPAHLLFIVVAKAPDACEGSLR